MLDEIVELGFLARYPGALIVHDWRSLRRLGPGAREVWGARARRPGNPFAKLTASYVAVSVGGVLRMSLQAGSLALQLATGQPPTRILTGPEEALGRHRIVAPSRTLLVELRAKRS